MAFDLHARFHETWLGMVQPVEGLVVSIPVLVEAQTMERHGPELQERFQALCPLVDAKSGLAIDDGDGRRSRRERAEVERQKVTAVRRYRDLGELLEQLLGWAPGLYDRGDALPPNLSRYIAEGHQTIRPTLALRRRRAGAARALAGWSGGPRRCRETGSAAARRRGRTVRAPIPGAARAARQGRDSAGPR